jgi:hypothetical protein
VLVKELVAVGLLLFTWTVLAPLSFVSRQA